VRLLPNKTIIGNAFIIHDDPDRFISKVPFDITKSEFQYDAQTYHVKPNGIFYGYMRAADRFKRRITALSIYRYNNPEPWLFDSPLPGITAEILKMMAGENITGEGIKSLRSAGQIRVNWKWVMMGTVIIVVLVVLFMLLPQIVARARGMV